MRRFPHTLIALLTALLLVAILSPPASASAAWVWPVSGEVITPYRNGTDPYAAGQHRGIDIAASVGTRVVAAAGGDVRFAGTAGSSGLTISIRTADGYDTSYLHLSSLAVREGTHVSAGDLIGAVGTTGVRSATAPHLHFGVRDAGSRHDYHDPLAFLPPPPPGAPEPPATAPAPSPPAAAPVVAPVGVPVPRPAHRGAPRPERRAEPRPVHQRTPRSLWHPRSAPHPAARPLLHPQRATAPSIGGAPSALARPHRVDVSVGARSRGAFAHHTRAAHAAGAAGAAGSIPAHATPFADALRAPASTTNGHPHRAAGGPDIAWVATCAGLLLAAALLGLTGDRRDTWQRRRSGPRRTQKLLWDRCRAG